MSVRVLFGIRSHQRKHTTAQQPASPAWQRLAACTSRGMLTCEFSPSCPKELQ